jgi:hypothetical protein
MHLRLFTTFLAAGLGGVIAQPRTEPGPPVPVVTSPARPAVPTTMPSEQRLYSAGATLVPPEHAGQIVEGFRAAYDRMGRPRLVIYVNRELVEERGGWRLSRRKEQIESNREQASSTHAAPPGAATPQTQVNVAVGGNTGAGTTTTYGPGETTGRRDRTTVENTFERADGTTPELADRQTVRDVERLFGRPLRIAGAQLADQRVIASLINDQPLDQILAQGGSESARKDREALTRVADVVVEILVSSRSLSIPAFEGSETRQVPDIQATAIRLSDGAIIGQASATDVLGRDRYAGPIVRQFDVRDIAEATALALMEDISVTAPSGN